MYSVLASAINHPDRSNPLWGLFNHRSLNALVRHGVDVNAVVPRPHVPPIGPYSSYRSIPRRDTNFSYPVAHPRFFYYLPKSLFYHRTGDSIASALASWYEDSRLSCDIFHGCHLYPDGYGLRGMSETLGVPFTAYAHGTIINSYDAFNRKTRQRIKTTLREAEVIFCSGNDIQSKALGIESRTNTRVVPIGATPENFPTERGNLLRQELNIPAEATVVLFCGQLSQAKGVQDILDVLPDIDDEQFYFVFIGHNGELKDDIHAALAEDWSPSGKLLWQLHPVAVRRWFATADLLLLPSYSEGRPTVIYEAMASKTPVLASTVGGIPEQVEEGETGWLIEPGNKSSLRVRLNNLQKSKLEEMGAAGEKRLIDKGWTWKSHAEAISDAHTAIIERLN